jgi:RHH-type rel operon transcriptional repressor/antitoxin RelB
MRKQAAIRLEDDVYKWLKELASKTGRTATFYMREAIEVHLEDPEDVFLAEQTLKQVKQVKQVKQGKQRSFSLSEVEREFGLEY